MTTYHGTCLFPFCIIHEEVDAIRVSWCTKPALFGLTHCSSAEQRGAEEARRGSPQNRQDV
jgi:hypothetical protein